MGAANPSTTLLYCCGLSCLAFPLIDKIHSQPPQWPSVFCVSPSILYHVLYRTVDILKLYILKLFFPIAHLSYACLRTFHDLVLAETKVNLPQKGGKMNNITLASEDRSPHPQHLAYSLVFSITKEPPTTPCMVPLVKLVLQEVRLTVLKVCLAVVNTNSLP